MKRRLFREGAGARIKRKPLGSSSQGAAAGGVFALCLLIVGWTSVKYGSDDRVGLRFLKGKRLTEKQRRKIKALGLSDEEIENFIK